MEDATIFQENVKNTFSKVKEHNITIEAQIKQLKVDLEEIKDKLNSLKESKKREDNIPPQEISESISTGNKGVNKHTNIQTYKHTNIQTYLQKESKETASLPRLEKAFKSLTKQEFEVFLLIYQLEDEKINPTYQEISERLSLSYGCLRAYICSMLKKGVPFYKKKLDNNSIILHIENDFKALSSQKKLVDLYYSLRGHQTKLQTY